MKPFEKQEKLCKLGLRIQKRIDFTKRLLGEQCPIVATLRYSIFSDRPDGKWAVQISSRPTGPYVEVNINPGDDPVFIVDAWTNLYQIQNPKGS